MVEMLSMALGAFLAAVGYKGYRVLYRCVPYLYQPFRLSRGKYYVVLGGTGGIGWEYVKYIVGQGGKVITVSKQPQITSRPPTQQQQAQVQHIQLDFSQNNDQYDRLVTGLSSLGVQPSSIHGVINCCGTAQFDTYRNTPSSQVSKLKSINTIPTEYLLGLHHHPLTSANPFLINISSFAPIYQVKYGSVYCGSKAYCSTLFKTYIKQHPDKNLLLNVEPWYVKTKMIGHRDEWDSVDAEEVVKGTFRVLGRRGNCAGTIKHEIIEEFVEWLRGKFDGRNEQLYSRVLKIKKRRKKP